MQLTFPESERQQYLRICAFWQVSGECQLSDGVILVHVRVKK